MGFKFHQRSVTKRKVSEVIAEMLASMPFSNVRRNRNRRPLDLTDQSVSFAFRQNLGNPVTLDNQGYALLPDLKVPITPYARVCWHLTPNTWHLLFSTQHHQQQRLLRVQPVLGLIENNR